MRSRRRGARRSTRQARPRRLPTGSTIRTSGARSRSSTRTCCASSTIASSTTISACRPTTASPNTGARAAPPARRCSIRAAIDDIAAAMIGFARIYDCARLPARRTRACVVSARHPSGRPDAGARGGARAASPSTGRAPAPPRRRSMQLELIERLKPTIWMGMSSYGLHLANLAEARGLDLAARSVETRALLGRAAVGRQAREARAPMGRAGARHVRHDRSRHDGRGGRSRARLPHLDRHVPDRGARSGDASSRSRRARSARWWSRRCGPTTSRRSCAGARAISSPGSAATTASGPFSVFPLVKHAHRTSGFFKIRGINVNHADFEDFMFRNVDDRRLQGRAGHRARSRRSCCVSVEVRRGVDPAASRRAPARPRCASSSS